MIPQNWIDNYYDNKERKDNPNKTSCPICGYEVGYVGFNSVDCSNPDCKNYPRPKHTLEIKEDDWEGLDDETKDLGEIVDDAYF